MKPLSPLRSRRETIRSLVGASLLLPGIVSNLLAESGAVDPLSPKAPHFTPRAKRVIFIFSNGGVSHMDTFDPKPKLFAADGKTLGVGAAFPTSSAACSSPAGNSAQAASAAPWSATSSPICASAWMTSASSAR